MKKEIEDIKRNKGIGAHPPFLAGEFLHWHATFTDERNRGVEQNLEMMRLVLVSIVSICESFYKELFARYIDAGEPYLSRAESLHKKNKPEINFEVLKGLAKKTFSLGDLFAYSLKYGSFKDMRENYETLLGEDYLDRIKHVAIPLKSNDASEVERAKSKASEIFAQMERVFLLRHALVHEYPANNVIITRDQLLDYLDAGWLLLMTTDRLFWHDTNLQDPFNRLQSPKE